MPNSLLTPAAPLLKMPPHSPQEPPLCLRHAKYGGANVKRPILTTHLHGLCFLSHLLPTS